MAQNGQTDRLVIMFGVVGLSESNDKEVKAWYANDLISINGLTGTYKLFVTDLAGRAIYSGEAELQHSSQVRLFLEPGIYLMNIQGGDETYSVKILVK